MFYGIPNPSLADVSKIRIPIQLHFGNKDDIKGFSDTEAGALSCCLYRYAPSDEFQRLVLLLVRLPMHWKRSWNQVMFHMSSIDMIPDMRSWTKATLATSLLVPSLVSISPLGHVHFPSVLMLSINYWDTIANDTNTDSYQQPQQDKSGIQSSALFIGVWLDKYIIYLLPICFLSPNLSLNLYTTLLLGPPDTCQWFCWGTNCWGWQVYCTAVWASCQVLGPWSNLGSKSLIYSYALTFWRERGQFTVAFSGGSLPGLVAPKLITDLKSSIEVGVPSLHPCLPPIYLLTTIPNFTYLTKVG